MKPPRFEYVAPKTEREALAALAEHGERAKILAGGQSLIPLMNLRLAAPEVLIDLNRVRELAYVREADGGVAIGAMTRQHAAERSELLQSRLPLLVEAVHHIGHLPIRHRGTIGGNLAHADPASELPAVMLALDAELLLASQQGQRTLRAQDFFKGPLSTALGPNELLSEIRLRGLPPRTGTAFVEMARRAGDYALVGVAAVISLDGAGRCTEARLALCGLGSAPVRAREAERALAGQVPRGKTLDEAASLAAEASEARSDIHASAPFRKKLARYFVHQALELAAQRGGGA